MNSRLIVHSEEGLKESPNRETPDFPRPLKIVAHLISYVFHPVFVPVYIVAYLVFIHPYFFAGFSPFDRSRTLIMSIMMYSFFPLVTVGLLKALKFIDSVKLNTTKERIIPLAACGIWYFWIWNVWRNLPDYPEAALTLSRGIMLSVFMAWLGNIVMKISLHGISMGALVGYFILLGFEVTMNMGLYIAISVFIAGLVCTSRFIVSDHDNKELYGGLALGMLSMWLAHLFS